MPLTIATDITNQRFGKLIAIGRDMTVQSLRAHWICRCDCGQTVTKMAKYLLCGDTRSCGCAQRAYRATGNIKHGGAHHGRMTREYRSWRDAKERCFNKSKRTYRLYGGRGITMCREWRTDFAAFLRHVGPCPSGGTLDRSDVNGHYEPGNVRWISQQQQCNNQRRNIRVMFNGCETTLADLARTVGVRYFSLYNRVCKMGDSVDHAVAHLRSLTSTKT